MLGKSVPNGNGRLALTLIDGLLKQLIASGAIKQSDIDTLLKDTATRLESEHSIASEGALMVLRSSQFGE